MDTQAFLEKREEIGLNLASYASKGDTCGVLLCFKCYSVSFLRSSNCIDYIVHTTFILDIIKLKRTHHQVQRKVMNGLCANTI